MASGKTHAVVGGVAGLGIYGIYKHQKKEDWTLLGAAGAASLGMVIALLPDIIESAARNPNHRQFFHSAVVLISAFLAYNSIGRDGFERLLVKTIGQSPPGRTIASGRDYGPGPRQTGRRDRLFKLRPSDYSALETVTIAGLSTLSRTIGQSL